MRDAALAFAAKSLGTLLSGPIQRALRVDQPAGRRELRTTGILSSVGDVQFTRWYVRRPDRPWCFPADEALGFVGGCTPGAAARLCEMGARSQSYAEASGALRLLSGIQTSANTIQRVIQTVGPKMAVWAENRQPATAQPNRDIAVCLQMDMTGVRVLKKYLQGVKGKNGPAKTRQIKCGVVYLLERSDDGRYHKIPDSSVHVLSFGDLVEFGAQLDKARQKLGAASVCKLIVISDGAEWIWNLVADRFRQAFSIVDFWHAAEHLHELCELVHGQGALAAERFKTLRRFMKRYGINGIIRHFEQLDLSSAKRRQVNKRLNYFYTHRDRMQYHRYRQAGWPIGSGEVEGACRSLIKQRTDLSGQRWSLNGALNVLWVRALLRDGLHTQFWKDYASTPHAKKAA